MSVAPGPLEGCFSKSNAHPLLKGVPPEWEDAIRRIRVGDMFFPGGLASYEFCKYLAYQLFQEAQTTKKLQTEANKLAVIREVFGGKHG